MRRVIIAEDALTFEALSNCTRFGIRSFCHHDQEKKGVWGIAPRVLTLILILVLHPPQGVWGTKSPKVLTLLIDHNHF